jgi:hypothetical protein
MLATDLRIGIILFGICLTLLSITLLLVAQHRRKKRFLVRLPVDQVAYIEFNELSSDIQLMYLNVVSALATTLGITQQQIRPTDCINYLLKLERVIYDDSVHQFCDCLSDLIGDDYSFSDIHLGMTVIQFATFLSDQLLQKNKSRDLN